MTWSWYTDLPEQRKGPATELMLGGVARDFVREIPFDHKVNGAIMDLDGTGPRHWTGMSIILQALNMQFGHLDEEQATHYLMELYHFRRHVGEPMDTYLARFTVLHHRSVNILGITLNPGQQAFMLMNGMGMDRRAQWDTLRTLSGRLPQNDAELERIKCSSDVTATCVRTMRSNRNQGDTFPSLPTNRT